MQVSSWDEQIEVEFKGQRGAVKEGRGPIYGYASRSKKMCAIVRVGQRLVAVPLADLKIVRSRKKRAS